MSAVFSVQDFLDWFNARQKDIAEKLVEFINIDTITPRETSAFDFIRAYVAEVGGVTEELPAHPDLSAHTAVSPHPLSEPAGVPSLRVTFGPRRDDLITTRFNSHVDVVPATDEFPAAFDGRIADGRVYGRGACDTKNNLIMIVEALRYLRERGIALGRNIDFDLPSEEEIGGNGTLSCIMHGPIPDEAICLEPTSLKVFRGHRGCLTFRIVLVGHSVHMGEMDNGVSAIEGAIAVIGRLKQVEQELLKEARQHPAFAIWDRPIQLNIGIIRGGEWSGSVPERCEVIGDIGFLPTHSLADAENLIRAACGEVVESWPHGRIEVDFQSGLRNDAYLSDDDAPVIKDLLDAAAADDTEAVGWNVSCDARHYAKVAGVPTVVFGSGALKDAHSAHEFVAMDELARGSLILCKYLTRERKKADGTLELRGNAAVMEAYR